MKSIKNKILFVVIAGLLVITAAVSAIAVSMTHKILHKDADRILKNVSQKEAALINDTLGDVIKSVSIMDHYATNEITSIDDIRDESAREKYIEKTKKMFVEIALNTSGIESVFIRLNPDYFQTAAGFYGVLTNSSTLVENPLTDITKYSKTDVQNVGWYYSAVEAGKGIWLDPYYYKDGTMQLISFVQPLYVNGELLGVVGFDMNFDYLIERINSIDVYEGGYALLIAKDGTTVYNPNQQTESNQPYAEAKVALENGMFLELRAEYKAIQRDLHPMLSKIVIAFLVVFLVSIIYTIVVTNKIVEPLKQLTTAAEEIALGGANADLLNFPTESKDEIGTLSRVLKGSYEKIQEYTTYINALAYRDSLTGIKNSTAYTEAVENINKEIYCGNPKFAVIVADINNLKKTNDNFGHDIGNILIKHTANILTETFKESSIFRIGGDEFAIILRNDECENYRDLLKEFDNACSKDFISVGDNTLPVSIARGFSMYDNTIDKVYEDVFAKADHAMYLDKESKKAARV